ncbi:MAG TPA: glycosyltransferase family 1 protein [Candidatus Acidoferrum sp.]|nr:glycosyltransferase family 1 protein [Candidatus Acidoferrum sp.]
MNSRHLLLITNYRPDAQWSMLQFSDLVQAAAENGGWRVTRLEPPARFGRGRNTTRGMGKYFGYLDKYMSAPQLFREAYRRALTEGDPPALVHITDHSNAIYNSCFGSTPILVTCHDLIAVRRALGEFAVDRPSASGRMQQKWILNSLRRADHAAFDSSASRDDFLRLTGSRPRSTAVIFPCLAQSLAPVSSGEARDRLHSAGINVRGPFILHHGNASWYKNREQVISVFLELRKHHPDIELVCSGAPLTAGQRRKLASVSNVFHEPGTVSAEILAALYSRATVFFFPSWVEGFGWPLVEAQACGCPVVASNAGSLAEVLGDSALLAPPDDTSAFKAHAEAVLTRPAVGAALRARGFRNIERFTRDQMAGDYLRLYDVIAPDMAERRQEKSLVAAG